MDLSKDKDPVINEKMKKNLVYVSIFSIIMFFAGLSSAYIVLMGDSIWVKAAMPGLLVEFAHDLAKQCELHSCHFSAKKDQLTGSRPLCQ